MGNSRSRALQMRAQCWRIFMLQSRRGFLIGVGAVLTTAFVNDARSFIHQTSQPLLASPSEVIETMYWHEIPDEGYQLRLGPWSFAPPAPTWREFFVREGISHKTDKDVEEICSSHCHLEVDEARLQNRQRQHVLRVDIMGAVAGMGPHVELEVRPAPGIAPRSEIEVLQQVISP